MMDKLTYSSNFDFSSIPQLKPLVAQLSLDDYITLVLLFVGVFGYLSYGKLWAKPDPYLFKLYERPQETFAITAKVETTKDISKQLLQQNKDVVIFWGSQSGTAEGLAHRLARDCTGRFGLKVIVADLSDYDPDSISKIPEDKFAIFLISTYGEGDPSDNTCDFLSWLQKRNETLSTLRYAAFGLGNSNYVYYNKVIDDVVAILDALSANALLPVGKADDADSGTEEDFASWRDDLFYMFHRSLGLEERVPEYTPSLSVTEITESCDDQPQIGEPQPLKLSRKAARDYSAIKNLPLREARTVTNTIVAGRSCLHLEIDIRGHPQIKYKTGDHLAVWPTNESDEVRRLINVLGMSNKENVKVIVAAVSAEDDFKIPKHSTISALFRHYLEISAPVSRDTVATLSQLAPTEVVRAFLQKLASKSAYAAFLTRHHLTFARLLEHTLLQDPSATWAHLPLAFVIESLRPMTPRYYSISSSSMTSPRQMAITVAISSSELPENPAVSISGLTTSYLSKLDASTAPSIFAHVRRSTFKMPFLHKTPIVLVAAGTGIAPFRGFLRERAQMVQISNQEIGPVLLVFGCRNPDQDYLYKEEIEQLQDGPLKGKLDVVMAFSRIVGQPKVYVQDRLSEPLIKAKIVNMLGGGEGNLYLCGSTAMAKTAGRTLVEAIREHQNGNEASGKAWMDSMKRSKRWQEDVWG